MLRVAFLVLLLALKASAYSVLTHEAIIDAAWDRSIRPLLLDRYPGLSDAELRKAHAYAYGGSILQDLGYYPLGSRFFSDLVHYVRGGDFVTALIDEAHDANEFAFGLGALAHYSADLSGHRLAINQVVPMLYPKLGRRYGAMVTYEQSPSAHLKTEFAFDVIHVAHQFYAPEAYHDFVGFEVAKPSLERAFQKTYGIELGDAFFNVSLALGTFRFAVSQLIPELSKVAWSAKHDELMAAKPGLTRERFVYNLSRASFQREWGDEYKRPGFFSRLLAFLFGLLPKVGPLQAFAFRVPGPQAQKLFEDSFNKTLDQYRAELATLRADGKLKLANENLDVGKATPYGTYKLTDKTYTKLLDKLSNRDTVAQPICNIVVNYFKGAKRLNAGIARKLEQLQTKGSSPSSSPGLP